MTIIPFLEGLRIISKKNHSYQITNWLFVASAIAVSIQLYFRGQVLIDKYYYFLSWNNYLIFKQTFIHLLTNDDLYCLNRYSKIDYWFWDYKYSPSFAVFMAPFAALPDWLGMPLWNLLNTGILLLSIRQIPWPNNKIKTGLLLFIFIEHITATQNCQSNSLIAGLCIFYLNYLEKNKMFLAALALVISIFIKPFTLVLLLLVPLKKIPLKFLISFFAVFSIVFLMPLWLVSPVRLAYYYSSWFDILSHDHSVSQGMSIMGFTESWFAIILPKNPTVVAGFLILLILTLFNNFNNKNQPFEKRILLFILSMIWMVIFNHKAESPTFIICMVAIGIWFTIRKKNTALYLFAAFTLICTSLSVTDIFPAEFKKTLLIPYQIKVLPCILAWFYILYDFIFFTDKNFRNCC